MRLNTLERWVMNSNVTSATQGNEVSQFVMTGVTVNMMYDDSARLWRPAVTTLYTLPVVSCQNCLTKAAESFLIMFSRYIRLVFGRRSQPRKILAQSPMVAFTIAGLALLIGDLCPQIPTQLAIASAPTGSKWRVAFGAILDSHKLILALRDHNVNAYN